MLTRADSAYTLEQFIRETHERVIDEAIRSDPEAILRRFDPKERLKGLDPATIKAWLTRQKPNNECSCALPLATRPARLRTLIAIAGIVTLAVAVALVCRQAPMEAATSRAMTLRNGWQKTTPASCWSRLHREIRSCRPRSIVLLSRASVKAKLSFCCA